MVYVYGLGNGSERGLRRGALNVELAPGSVLIGRGGVFGHDMFYWRLVYNVRPDVVIPMIEGPRPSPEALAGAGPIYTTQPPDPRRPGRGPRSPPPGLLKPDSWYIPVLLGQGGTSSQGHHRSGLTLYQLSGEPPELVVQQTQPERVVGQPLGGLVLVGYGLEDDEVSQAVPLKVPLVVRLLDSRASHREEALVSRPSARPVTCLLEGRM